MELSVVWKFLFYGSVCCMKMSVLWKCLFYGSVCCMELFVVWSFHFSFSLVFENGFRLYVKDRQM